MKRQIKCENFNERSREDQMNLDQTKMNNRHNKSEVLEERRIKSEPNVFNNEEVNQLIPAFNPSSSSGPSAKQWIETIENIKRIYAWDERQTLMYASMRLEEKAMFWFRDNLCSWPEFKLKFVKEFEKTDDCFEQLLHRRKESDESYENYVYDVVRIAEKCGFNLEATINYIISGLRDSNLRHQLISYNCKSVNDVMLRIESLNAAESRKELRIHLDYSGNGKSREEENCKACGKRGHDASDCSIAKRDRKGGKKYFDDSEVKRTVMCVRCKKLGHYSINCISPHFRDHAKETRDAKEERRNNNMFCHKCKETGHFAYKCPMKGVIRTVDPSHTERLLSNRNPSQETRSQQMCYNCREPAHFVSDCKFNSHSDQKRRSFERSPQTTNQIGRCSVEAVESVPLSSNVKEEPKDEEGPICYKCRKPGHYAVICPTKIKRPSESPPHGERSLKRNSTPETNIRKEPGHRTFDCKKFSVQSDRERHSTDVPKFPKEPANSPIQAYSDLLKTVQIDEISVTALVNLGSEYTTLKVSEFKRNHWKMQPCNLILKGFGNASTEAIGKICKNVKVGEVEMLTEIIIVENNIQEFPLVLGCNFLDHPNVCLIKNYKSLIIKKSELQTKAKVSGGESNKSAVNFDLDDNQLLELLGDIERDCL